MQNHSKVGDECLTASPVRRQAQGLQELLRRNGTSEVKAVNANTNQLVADLLLE
jgi:hypothetical protein